MSRRSLTTAACVLLAGWTSPGAAGPPSADVSPAPQVRSLVGASVLEAIERHDRAVNVLKGIWLRDPYVVIGPDGWYYFTSTRLFHHAGAVPGDHDTQGLEIWRSRDLGNWESLGVPWKIEDLSWREALHAAAKERGRDGPDLWAPELHFKNGKWIVVHTTSAGRSNILMADEVAGPYREPMPGQAFGHRHDPSLFTDDDGTHYLVSRCAEIAPLRPDFSGYAAEHVHIGPSNRKMGHEGCLIRKIGTKYVLFGTAWSTDRMRHGTYNLYYCTADSVKGPYGPRRFVGRFLGHGTPFQDKQGRWWCTAFRNGRYVTPGQLARMEKQDREALTTTESGFNLVPLEVRVDGSGDVLIRAEDPRFAAPGPEEAQQFNADIEG